MALGQQEGLYGVQAGRAAHEQVSRKSRYIFLDSCWNRFSGFAALRLGAPRTRHQRSSITYEFIYLYRNYPATRPYGRYRVSGTRNLNSVRSTEYIHRTHRVPLSQLLREKVVALVVWLQSRHLPAPIVLSQPLWKGVINRISKSTNDRSSLKSWLSTE